MQGFRYSLLKVAAGIAATLAFTVPAFANERSTDANKAAYPSTDVMSEFFRAYDSSTNVFDRLAAFKQSVIVPHRDLFDTNEFKLDDVHLAWYLLRIGPRIEAMRAISHRLEIELPLIERRFDDAFPEMSGISVAIMPSFSHFDGQTHAVPGGGVGVFLAPDGIAEFDGDHANLGVIVSHEFFHAYQAQIGHALAPLYADRRALVKIWTEGLAAYASMALTPGATPENGLLDPNLAHLDPAKARILACLVRERTRTKAADVDDLLDAGLHPEGLPPRGGYLIGFTVARELARTHTLNALAKLGGSALETAFDTEIDRACAK